MAQTLEYNQAAVTAAALTVPSCDVYTENIRDLDDEPNDVGGMTAEELKTAFDRTGEQIVDYLNGDLIPAIIAADATEEARAAAEAERVANEQERVGNELSRVSAETARASAETARASAETARASAETARASAETARADETSGIVARSTAQANAAAGSASAASASAAAAQTWASRSPYIGDNGHWFVWDAAQGAFQDSGISAQGPQGPSGPYNPNLIDNWHFVGGGSQQGGSQFPINQRGQTSYTVNGNVIDRWIKWDAQGELVLTDSGLEFKSAYFTFVQIPDKSIITPGVYTFSILTESSTFNSFNVFNEDAGQFFVPATIDNGLIYGTITFSESWVNSAKASTHEIRLGILGRAPGDVFEEGVTWMTIKAAKFERGNTQTLAHKDSNDNWVLNEVPNFQEQLFRCQTSTADPSDTYANKTNVVDNYYSRPNLLDNAYFVGGGSQQGGSQLPINQRGQTSYSGSGYGIDRWKILYEGNTMRLAADGLYINCFDAGQFVDNSKIVLNRNYTFSLLTTDNKFGWITFKFTGQGSTVVEAIGNTGVYSNFIYNWNLAGTTPFFLNTNRAEIGIVAVKLELGNGQTLAHQENGVWVLNEIPDYAIELAKCQRNQVIPSQSAYQSLGIAIARSSTSADIVVPIPVTMARNPDVELDGSVIFSSGGSTVCTVSQLTRNMSSPSSVSIFVDTASNLTPGAAYFVYLDAGSKLILNANP